MCALATMDILVMESNAQVFDVIFFELAFNLTSKDINECDHANTCDSNAQCINTPGSYQCTCNEGYEKIENICTGNNWSYGAHGKLILFKDIDECKHNSSLCSMYYFCANTPGSYYCNRCPSGFTSTKDGSSCIGMLQK